MQESTAEERTLIQVFLQEQLAYQRWDAVFPYASSHIDGYLHCLHDLRRSRQRSPLARNILTLKRRFGGAGATRFDQWLEQYERNSTTPY